MGSLRAFSLTRKPGFTAPFIISTWLLLGAVVLFVPELRLPAANTVPTTTPRWLGAYSFNLGQVMFQGSSVLTGLFFLTGTAAGDVRRAVYTLWGAALPLGAFLLSDYEAFNAGLYGYNGVLCAIVLTEWIVMAIRSTMRQPPVAYRMSSGSSDFLSIAKAISN